MALLYQVDFRTLPNQTIGAAGAYTIDGKSWWAKGQLTGGGNTLISNVENGNGIHFDLTAGGGTTPLAVGSNPQVWRHLWLPLSQFAGWSTAKAYMVRARFQKNGSGSASAPFIGVTSTTNDSVGLTAAQRPGEFLVAPTPQDGTTANLDYKLGIAAPANVAGRAGAILNNECVVAVYHFTTRFALIGSEHLASGMPTDPASWLAAQTVATADFDGLRSNPGVLVTQDSGNNDWYLQQLRIETIGDISDVTPPTVTWISPAVIGGVRRMHRRASVVVRVADTTGIARSNLWVKYASGITETIYAGGEFQETFAAGSTVQTIVVDKELEFTFTRAGGWPVEEMDFYAEPIDRGGNYA